MSLSSQIDTERRERYQQERRDDLKQFLAGQSQRNFIIKNGRQFQVNAPQEHSQYQMQGNPNQANSSRLPVPISTKTNYQPEIQKPVANSNGYQHLDYATLPPTRIPGTHRGSFSRQPVLPGIVILT